MSPGRDRSDAVFAALADATRRDVLRHLSERGPGTATELAGRLPVSRQAVAKHLAALAEAGLVEADREGREVRYRITPSPLRDATSWIEHVEGEWDERLRELRRHLGRG